MESLDNLEPYDDLKDWSDNIDLFVDAMSHPLHMADILWKEIKNKKQGETSKTPEESNESIFDKPWTKEPEGLTPTQSWLHWMNENALQVEWPSLSLVTQNTHTQKSVV